MNYFELIAPVICYACLIKISRKIGTFQKARIGRSFIDKLHGKKFSRQSICESFRHLIFFCFQRNVRGYSLCIRAVSGADVWQRCLVKVNSEIFRYFIPHLHFFDFSLKVKFGLIKECRSYRHFSSSCHSRWHFSSISVKLI